MIIVTHMLFLRKSAGDIPIEIRIQKPIKLEKSWGCRYDIDWPEGTHGIMAQGEDALQSLTGALQMIGAELYTSTYHEEGALRSAGAEEGYGFPVPNNIRDMLVGIDKISF